ncbi:DUF899 domain-containing protein [Patulibacter defluvii]|uniref:DUF899 domain-containing protein n=1 Tax=Patulibacter defluvii TaxID=3095358 RepID=UPI002A747908|nr:DUF899 family protein [Patulibacter sp. DM4]
MCSEADDQARRTMALPPVVDRATWLAARRDLLEREREAARLAEALAARRRQLPMVAIDKAYRFDGLDGPAGLLDLFEGRRQLIVYHFMFDPTWDAGCTGCTAFVDNLCHLPDLHARETTLVLVSRAPQRKLEPYRRRRGWRLPWYSSFGSEFNYDFHVTLDPRVAPAVYDYRSADELREAGMPWFASGEQPGLSVFLREGEQVFHSYSAYASTLEQIVPFAQLLDLTPLGRQDDCC